MSSQAIIVAIVPVHARMPGSHSPADYRRAARRLRRLHAGQPTRLQFALSELARREDAIYGGPRSEGREPRADGRGRRVEGGEPRAEGRRPRFEGREPRAEGRGLRFGGGEPRAETVRVRRTLTAVMPSASPGEHPGVEPF